MRFDSNALTVRLKPRQILSLPGKPGACVRVRRGSVWITEDRNQADIVLEPGQSHASAHAGTTLIYGLEDAEIDIEDSPSARFLRPQVHQ
jgi:Protein of unknown function (DUF2917)